MSERQPKNLRENKPWSKRGPAGTHLTPTYDAFARAYIECRTAKAAYMKISPDCPSERHAKEAGGKLLRKPAVKARIEEIQEGLRERTEITLEKLTEMELEAYEMAKEEGGAVGSQAITAAVKQLSKMHGFDVKERKNARDPFEALDAEQRTKLLDAIDGELARRKGEASLSPEAGQA